MPTYTVLSAPLDHSIVLGEGLIVAPSLRAALREAVANERTVMINQLRTENLTGPLVREIIVRRGRHEQHRMISVTIPVVT